MCFIANFLTYVSAKNLAESVNIWQSYHKYKKSNVYS